MADIVPNNSGDKKESSPPSSPPPQPEKKQKTGEGNLQGSISAGSSASKTPLEVQDEEADLLDALAVEMVLSKEDNALEDVTLSLNKGYPSGRCDDAGDKWFKFLRRIVHSEGFDIEMDELPVTDFSKLPFVPLPNPNMCPDLVESAKVAINHFNQEEGTNYEFVKVAQSNGRLWCHGANSYITFDALPENPDPSTCLTTFQALVWTGPEKFSPYVKFVRPKAFGN